MRLAKHRPRFSGGFPRLHGGRIPLGSLAVSLVWTGVVCLTTTAAAAVQMPTWKVPYVPGPVKVDGKLDDPAYAKAFRWDHFVQIDPGDNTPPSRKSVLYLFSTDDALIVGVRCFDPHPEQIWRTRYRRDQYMDEHLEILLDAFGAAKQAYFLAITPMNDVTDGTYDLASGDLNLDFDIVFDHAAIIDREGWSAEIRIPFASINYLQRGGGGSWYFSLTRFIPRKFFEGDSAVPSSRSSSDPLDSFARIIVTHVPAARTQGQWRVIPSEVVSRVDTRTQEETGPSTSGVSTQGAFGVTGEWMPSSRTSLKGTINPDFSQVEADDTYQRINNRYPVFFSEKRPFFMDGMESFNTPIDLLDTRNIVKPELGVKLSTKGKRLGLYGISALEQDVPAERFGLNGGPRDTWWHVLRATWGTRPKGSFIGAMVTERDFGSDFNRVISMDGVQRFGRLTATYQGAVSQTGSEGDTDSGNGGSLALNYKWSRYFTTSVYYDVLSPGFRADSGYLARVDFRSYQLVQDFYYRPRS
ncbi:MAG: DUF5916 domain-containing protein, partial [Acidobacteria bacterium]|nr:DUF5916 domain-containing protein [Acidobacteriota bacterium]